MKLELNVSVDDSPNAMSMTVYGDKKELLGELRLPNYRGGDISKRERRDAVAAMFLASLDAAMVKAFKAMKEEP